MAGHCITHAPADDETDRGVGHAWVNVYGERAVPGALPAPHHGLEVDAAAQSDRRGQHEDARIRQRACRGPYGGGRPEWYDRRGSASATGNRACGHAGGCSVDRCACSRSILLEVRRHRRAAMPEGHAGLRPEGSPADTSIRAGRATWTAASPPYAAVPTTANSAPILGGSPGLVRRVRGSGVPSEAVRQACRTPASRLPEQPGNPAG